MFSCATMLRVFALLFILEGAKPQFGFPTSVPTGRVAGRNPICVPAGTCAAQMGQVIDPRIVTNGQQGQQQQTCGNGEVLCLGVLGGDSCGRRFETVPLGNGPAASGAHPWQAYIMNQTGYTGSGVLLDSTHILTAAHKVYDNRNTPNQIRIYMGVHNAPTLTNLSRYATSVKVHENYDPIYLKNDIAVLTLNEPIPLGYRKDISTLCLPSEGSSSGLVGKTCMVAGWGMTAFQANDAPTALQKQVNVPIVSYDECSRSMSQPDVLGSNTALYLDDKEFCAGGVEQQDACTEDGGAPLNCNVNGRNTAAGLVIWGKGCGRRGVYGVYVDVAKYLQWIQRNV